MTLDQRRLDRVEGTVGALEVLDRDELLAVEHRHELDAAVDGPVAHDAALELAQHHRTGAAIALGATLLGAGAALDLAQVAEHREVGVHALELADLAAEDKAHRACGLCRLGVWRRHPGPQLPR